MTIIDGIDPKPFCFNKKRVKAFVLGADPTNKSNRGKRIDLDYVFGIGQHAGYFWKIDVYWPCGSGCFLNRAPAGRAEMLMDFVGCSPSGRHGIHNR